MTQPTAQHRVCLWCDGPIPARARRDALTCSQRCRQARHRITAAVRDGLPGPHDASRGSTRQVLGDGLPRGAGDAYASRDPRGSAAAHDSFDDLFPGSGIVSRCWTAYTQAVASA